jgi:hypothetical protein
MRRRRRSPLTELMSQDEMTELFPLSFAAVQHERATRTFTKKPSYMDNISSVAAAAQQHPHAFAA